MNFPWKYNRSSRIESDAVAFATNQGAAVHAYAWDGVSLGAKYANPAVLPPSECTGIAWTSENDVIAVSTSLSPYIAAWAWSSGFGTKYSNPSTLPGGKGWGIAFAKDKAAIAVSHDFAPVLTAYSWTVGGGFGTKYSDPSSGWPNHGHAVTFSNGAMAVAHQASSYISVHGWNSATGFGSRYSNPSTLPTGDGWCVAFRRQEDAISVGHLTTPFFSVYPWSDGLGFGTKYSLAGTGLNSGRGTRFSPTGGAMVAAFSAGAAPFIQSFPFDPGSGFSAAYSQPVSPPLASTWSASYTASGGHVSIGHNASVLEPLQGCFSIYPWDDGSGYGVRLSPPSVALAGAGWGTAFNGRS